MSEKDPAQAKAEDYLSIFDTMHGQRVLRDLMTFCHFVSTTSDPDESVRSEREGRRQVLLYILSFLNMDIDLRYLRDQYEQGRYHDHRQIRQIMDAA